MPAAVYECMFLLDPTKVGGDVPGAAKQLHAILEKHNAEVLASRPWDERRLAYPIKAHKKGLYYLIYFRADGPAITKIRADATLNESILRMLILKIDPKLVDIMLQLARDEHAVALQTAHETEGEGDEGGRGEGEGGPRRGRRPLPVGEE
jgi:small subunit ribosomal protein S6